jgi:hypothetical protein
MNGPHASLIIYADANRTSALKTITGKEVAPFVVHSDTFAYSFTDKSPRGTEPSSWGFRVIVSPIWRLQWLREEQVLDSPSLEWGMWLMNFLMTEAPEVAATGALHHKCVMMRDACAAVARVARVARFARVARVVVV